MKIFVNNTKIGSGVYAIKNTLDGKLYIGSSIEVMYRLREHIRDLSKNQHHNKHLQNAWNKYKKDNFVFLLLCKCDAKELIIKESEKILKFKSNENGYNYDIPNNAPIHQRLFKWLRVAEELTSKDNMLPSSTWLIKNGYSKLYSMILKYPHIFKHLKRRKNVKSLLEQVKQTEEIAKNNNGKLPCYHILRKMKKHGLLTQMYNSPEHFAHIPKDKKKLLSVQDHIDTVKTMINERSEIRLKNIRKTNSALCRAMEKHPTKFDFVKIYKKNTTQDHIDTIKRLTNQNNGVMPSFSWLKANGYTATYHYIQKNKLQFSHLIKDNIGKKILRESVKLAEKLTINNNGILPSYKWLKANGYKSLTRQLGKSPESFSHINRRKR